MGKIIHGIYLRHVKSWYNPFFLYGYELKNIHFFDSTGIRFSTGHGWFGRSNNEIKGGLTVLDSKGQEMVFERKNKTKFSLNHAFLIPVKRKYYEREGRFAELYLPYDRFEWKVERDGRVINYPTETYFFDVWHNLTLGVDVEQHTRIEPQTEIIQYLERIKPLMLLGVRSEESLSQFHLLENRSKIEQFIREWDSKPV